jgi:hypothetical protein
LTAEPSIGAPVPEVAIVEAPSLSEVPIAPQPFSISELKQRLGGGLAADAAWSRAAER